MCLDETSKQLLAHTRVPIAAGPGRRARVDDEFERRGTADIFAAVEPLTGWCLVEATERRTNIDMAHFLRRISDEAFPDALLIVLVIDNLSIHTLSCMYEAFEPAEARRLTKRFEVHYTPRHGSWPNWPALRCCADRDVARGSDEAERSRRNASPAAAASDDVTTAITRIRGGPRRLTRSSGARGAVSAEAVPCVFCARKRAPSVAPRLRAGGNSHRRWGRCLRG